MSRQEMDNEKCKTLIRLYSEREFLWNLRLPKCRNKTAREQAWKEIGDTMGLPIPMLKTKMTSLLAAYRKEKSRIKESKKPSSKRNSVYESKWFAFEDFAFMSGKKTQIATEEDHLITEMKTENEETIELNAFSLDPVTFAEVTYPDQFIERKNSVSISAEDDILNNGIPTQETQISDVRYKDSYYTFGQYVANELRKYDSFALAHVKRAISNVIFDADLGKYNRIQYSDTIDTSQHQMDT